MAANDFSYIPPEGFGGRLLIQGDGLPMGTHIYAVAEDGTRVSLPCTKIRFEMDAGGISRVEMSLIVSGVDLDVPYPTMIREYAIDFSGKEQGDGR